MTGTLSSIRKQDITKEDTSQAAEGTLPYLKHKPKYSVYEMQKKKTQTNKQKQKNRSKVHRRT